MNNTKIINFVKNSIAALSIIALYYIVNEYDDINDYYIQKKENYTDLKQLNAQILDIYKIDLKSNEQLVELKMKVDYDEHMINASEPNTQFSEYYLWILIGLCWLFILSRRLGNSKKPAKNKTEIE